MTPAILAAAFILAFASTAQADPCKAIPDKGPAPAWLKPGAQFSGPVTYIGDGDGLCVATGPTPNQWIEVRLSDYYAPELSAPGGREAKAKHQSIAMGRRISCVYLHRSYDRAVSECDLNGSTLGDLMRRAGAPVGGRGAR